MSEIITFHLLIRTLGCGPETTRLSLYINDAITTFLLYEVTLISNNEHPEINILPHGIIHNFELNDSKALQIVESAITYIKTLSDANLLQITSHQYTELTNHLTYNKLDTKWEISSYGALYTTTNFETIINLGCKGG